MNLSHVNKKIVNCKLCPRLIDYCTQIASDKRKAFKDWDYWGKPVPHFGEGKAELLIVGLAPAAHGANRTGRMFTGDRSGEWLYRALHKAGFCNQAASTDRDDGLKLINTVITAVNHCAPPDNKPEKDEIKNCMPYLRDLMEELPVKVIVALGQIAWQSCLAYAFEKQLLNTSKPNFSHGAICNLANGILLIGSYHPSQQNTFTKRLTEEMFDSIFARANQALKN